MCDKVGKGNFLEADPVSTGYILSQLAETLSKTHLQFTMVDCHLHRLTHEDQMKCSYVPVSKVDTSPAARHQPGLDLTGRIHLEERTILQTRFNAIHLIWHPCFVLGPCLGGFLSLNKRCSLDRVERAYSARKMNPK